MQLGTASQGSRENLLDFASPVAEALSQPKTMPLIWPLTHFYTHWHADLFPSSLLPPALAPAAGYDHEQ